jgi:histidinol-phosphate aminotransferase
MTTSSRATSTLAFNAHIAALPAYNAGLNLKAAQRIAGRQDLARLASNENPHGCSPRVLEALRSLEPWRYADPACTDLREALAARVGVDPADIVVGNGSEEMIAAVSRAVLEPHARAVTVVPSFGLHEIEPLAAGASVTKIPMTAAMDFDLDALIGAMADGPRLVFLSSPWNPVGPALDAPSLARIVAATRPGTLLVLDEAYFEFARGDVDALAMLRGARIPHVILRTFSKAHGLAGLRVGYAICADADIARVVAAAKPPFNVNVAAQTAALAALQDEAWMRSAVARICAERDATATALAGLGLRCARSETNFLFFDTGQESDAVAQRLLRHGVIVKPWREAGYITYLRATVGLPDENARLVAALRECL